jgi:hypothetical protein
MACAMCWKSAGRVVQSYSRFVASGGGDHPLSKIEEGEFQKEAKSREDIIFNQSVMKVSRASITGKYHGQVSRASCVPLLTRLSAAAAGHPVFWGANRIWFQLFSKS